MTEPLALLLYERLLPGGQLVNRLQDKGYRVQVLAEPSQLAEQVERDKPLLVLADLEPRTGLVCQAIGTLKQRDTTAHVPIIAFSGAENTPAQEAARAAGAKLVVHDTAILIHLDHFLEQALQLD